jgi:hypothetical protein
VTEHLVIPRTTQAKACWLSPFQHGRPRNLLFSPGFCRAGLQAGNLCCRPEARFCSEGSALTLFSSTGAPPLLRVGPVLAGVISNGCETWLLGSLLSSLIDHTLERSLARVRLISRRKLILLVTVAGRRDDQPDRILQEPVRPPLTSLPPPSASRVRRLQSPAPRPRLWRRRNAPVCRNAQRTSPSAAARRYRDRTCCP